jgi:hypothetical protein
VVGGVPEFSLWLLPALLVRGHIAVLRGDRRVTATVTATAADKTHAGQRSRVHRWVRAGGRRHDADTRGLMVPDVSRGRARKIVARGIS